MTIKQRLITELNISSSSIDEYQNDLFVKFSAKVWGFLNKNYSRINEVQRYVNKLNNEVWLRIPEGNL